MRHPLGKELRMSLLCGECRNDIDHGHGFLYRLERDETGKPRPTKDPATGQITPNSAVCNRCWQQKMPAEARLAKVPEADVRAGPAYFYRPADSRDKALVTGTKTRSVTVMDAAAGWFVRPEDVALRLPRALVIIDDMARRLRWRTMVVDPGFVETVRAYLARAGIRIKAWAELAPGAVGIEDTSGGFLAYLDPERWTARPDPPFGDLPTPRIVSPGLSILDGTKQACPATSMEKLSFHALRSITRAKGDCWREDPMPLLVPADLRADHPN